MKIPQDTMFNFKYSFLTQVLLRHKKEHLLKWQREAKEKEKAIETFIEN